MNPGVERADSRPRVVVRLSEEDYSKYLLEQLISGREELLTNSEKFNSRRNTRMKRVR